MVEYIALSSMFEVVTRLMFPLLNTASRPLSICFRSNCFDFDFPCIRFRFPDRALPFLYPFPNKNMKMKVVRVFSRSFPTAFIPTAGGKAGAWVADPLLFRPCLVR